MFLGENLLPLLMLAMGGALFVGNVIALVHPRSEPKAGELERPPIARTVIMALAGLVAAVWALASLTR